MPTIIKHWNDPNNAITLNGLHVRRERSIWLDSYKTWLPVLPQSMHFCFRDTSVPSGTTLFCTCGAPAIIVGYEAYRQYNSFIGAEVIACHHFIQYGSHSDGSHE